METKPIILTFTEHYLPGCMGGGPIRTIANIVDILGDEFDFMIVTRDRDLGSSKQYTGIKIDGWQKVGKAAVFYISPGKISMAFFCRLINSTPHDILYLNSFFSPMVAIIPMVLRRLGLIPNSTTIIAPRGEFSLGALEIKSFKKRTYTLLAKIFKLYEHVIWQASSPYEREDIRLALRDRGDSITSNPVIVAPDLSSFRQPISGIDKPCKSPGSLKIVFLSRISPKKNLDGAINMLMGLIGEITFNIFGPLEDITYWEKCQEMIKKLPSNIQVHHKGSIAHEEVVNVMSAHDLFFFPSHGENFGHVIIEALVAGCLVLISDQTPWRYLQTEGVGWDFSLDQPEKFTAVLQKCVDMESSELMVLSHRTREFGLRKAMDNETVQQNRNLFNSKSAHN